MALAGKDLLGLRGISREEITQILDLASEMKQNICQAGKKADRLLGKQVVTLFFENSTRTRTSFESAARRLSADVLVLDVATSSVQKGETLIDSGKNIDAMGVDAIVIRHPHSGAPALLASQVRAAVINAGDGMNEHPTQALLDMMTMRERFGTLSGLHVVIAGDIYHSRVARSNLWGLQKMGATVSFAAPATLMPAGIEAGGARVYTDLDAAVRDADVVMGLRIQRERQHSGLLPSVGEYSRFYGITPERLAQAKPHCILMHPGPFNPGVEMALGLPEAPQSVIFEQVTNGVAVRMAVLALLIEGGKA